ncbi:MAG: hypothetical protein ACRDQ2_14745 [Gaiellales bacterium]
MARWLISTSSSRAFAALGTLTLLASADAGVRTAADVRPRMTVTVDIQGSDFTELLPPAGRDSLLGFMHDSLRHLLERNFGFLDWREGVADRRDTLRVRWIQRSAAPQDALLELTLRGPTIGADSSLPPLLFEKWARMQTRLWQPGSVSREWSATIDTIFKRQRGTLVSQLFGRMPLQLTPLQSNVKLLGRDLAAVIRLRPDQISAADSAKPEFLVRITLKDTVPPRSVGDGSLTLRRCLPSLDEPGYVCRMDSLAYQEETTSGAQRRTLLARAVLLPQSVHLLRYQPAGVLTGPGGTVAP